MTLEAQTTILHRVDGSASLHSGETKTIVSVAGPIEPKVRQELPTTSALEVTIRADVGISNTREKLMEDKLRTVLTQTILGLMYPRQLIQITAQILEAGEDTSYTCKEMATVINAAYLALVDANVGLNASFAAESFAIMENGEILANPSREELKLSKSSHIVVFQIKNGVATELLFIDSIGSFTEKEVYTLIDLAEKKTTEVHQTFKKTIQSKIEKDFVWQL
ncbi:CYFA0S01e07008g1_1 [Cyberlindnera fabianii]|uniref:CYFA0S01e07008g1_1 n=1 Tax=Cyberlindnera fabianii TaxID=36022 RepID=A0A061AHM7_CYBFA|nr:Exosome complex component RRP46 [Cyberlindnera fabianii]CDR37069.1 CYFA0S01e07008g1_1 [Cyberlindnera fabianii]